MKLFSLISEEKVVLKAGIKKIPESELTTVLEAKELLEKVKKEVISFKKEMAIDAEKEREIASQEGFCQGLEDWTLQIVALQKEMETLRKEVADKILPIALTAAKKIVGEELKLHPERIFSIVMQAIKPVLQHKKIRIYVNKQDLLSLEEKKEKIKEAFEHLEALQLLERADVQPGGCMIETEAGIINAQLENQWQALEKAFLSYK